MLKCPNCGTPMDFIERDNQWYCPNCREYNPQFNYQHSHRTQPTNKSKKTSILISIILIVIIIIIAAFGLTLLRELDEPRVEIESVDLEPGSMFEYRYTCDNPSGDEITLKWVVQLIENGTVVSSSEFTETISDYKTDKTANRYIEFDGNSSSAEKYRVEVYLDDKLMDSVEKDL